MPIAQSEVETRIENLEAETFSDLHIDRFGRPLVDLVPIQLELEGVTASSSGAFVALSWMNWRPEVESYEIWMSREGGDSELIAQVDQPPAVFTVAVEQEEAVIFTVVARAGRRSVSFERSPSVAAVIPAPVSTALGPNSVGDSHLRRTPPDRVVITSADILNLTANKLIAGTIDAAEIDVINLNASNIVTGMFPQGLIAALMFSASQIISGQLPASVVDAIQLNANQLTSGALNTAIVNALRLNANQIDSGELSQAIIDAINLNANQITSGELPEAVVNALRFNANQINAGALSQSIVDAIALRANQITSGELSSTIVNALRLNANQITSGELPTTIANALSLDAGQLASGELSSAIVNAIRINASQITAGVLNAAIVNAIQINANQITAGVLNAAIVNAIQLNASQITAGVLNAAIVNAIRINASQINAGIISADRLRIAGTVYITAADPTAALGINGNTAVDILLGKVWDKANDVWEPRTVAATAPTGFAGSVAERTVGNTTVQKVSVTLDNSDQKLVEIQLGYRDSGDATTTYSGSRETSGFAQLTQNVLLRSARFEFDETLVPDFTYVRSRFLGELGTKSAWIERSLVAERRVLPSVTLVASDDIITLSDLVTLYWTSENATSAVIDEGVGPVAPVASGSVQLRPLGSTTYTITVSDDEGNTASAFVFVNTNPLSGSAPRFQTSSDPYPRVSPSVITEGGSSVIRWSVNRASTSHDHPNVLVYDADIGGRIVPTPGGNLVGFSANAEVRVYPTRTRTYTVYGVNSRGVVFGGRTITVNPYTGAPEILEYSASNLTPSPGDTVTITWRTRGANSILLSQGIGNVLSSGSFHYIVPLSASGSSHVIRLTLEAAGHTNVTQDITLTVANAAAPTIDSFVASPSSLLAGAQGRLQWATSNVTAVSINQGIGTVETSGSVEFIAPASGTRTYTITATGANGSIITATVTITVVVGAAPTIDSFTASTAIVNIGDSLLLAWQTSDALSVSIDNGVGSVPVDGSIVVTPEIDVTSFKITATGVGGQTIEQTVNIQVLGIGSAPIVDSFTTSSAIVSRGSSFTLAWQTTDADDVSIDHGIGDVSNDGSQVVNVGPSDSIGARTYTLRALGSGGVVIKTVEVQII